MVMRSVDREIKLERTGDVGIIDPTVFTGKNRLRIIMDPVTTMWSFKYDRGVVPPHLQGRYTTFKKALTKGQAYFKQKNIKIQDILD
jgi:hypothetical protein